MFKLLIILLDETYKLLLILRLLFINVLNWLIPLIFKLELTDKLLIIIFPVIIDWLLTFKLDNNDTLLNIVLYKLEFPDIFKFELTDKLLLIQLLKIFNDDIFIDDIIFDILDIYNFEFIVVIPIILEFPLIFKFDNKVVLTFIHKLLNNIEVGAETFNLELIVIFLYILTFSNNDELEIKILFKVILEFIIVLLP